MGLCCPAKQEEQQKIQENSVGKENFQFFHKLGQGGFGQVYLVKENSGNNVYAMKIIDKKQIKKLKCRNLIENEKTILKENKCLFIVKLFYAFQDEINLYLVMEFCEGGELFFHLIDQKQFSLSQTQFYAAEILIALEYLHQNQIVYRDLKPENVLLDRQGHIKLTDFGLSRQEITENKYIYEYVGTIDYMAPDIFKY